MLNLTQPRYVMPLHGDFRRLQLHGQLAESVGIHPEDIFRGRNGLPLEIDERGARFGEPEQAGVIFVDGVDLGDPEDIALRDRRMLSADGIFIVVATIAEQDGRSVAPPELIFRGVPFIEGDPELLDELRAAVDDSLAKSAEEEIREIDLLQDHLHDDIAQVRLRPPAGGARWCCRSSSRSSASRAGEPATRTRRLTTCTKPLGRAGLHGVARGQRARGPSAACGSCRAA